MRSILLLFSVWPCLAVLAAPAAPVQDSPPALRVIAGPFLQDLGPDSAVVTWVTDREGAAWIQWPDATGGLRRAVSSRDGLVDAPTRFHRIRVDGLAPDTEHRLQAITRAIARLEPYRIIYGPSVTNALALRTPPARPDRVSFAIVNDLHDQAPLLRKLIASVANAPLDGVFLNGDIINDPRTEEQILAAVVRPAADLLGMRTPIYFIRGNHETRGAWARRIGDLLGAPDERWFRAFTRGPIRFVILDCGEDKADTHPAYSGLADFDRHREEQARWLAAEVESAPFRDARFRIVVCHMPLFSTSDAQDWHGPAHARALWAPILRKAGIHAYFAGHTHRAEVIEPDPRTHDYPIFIGGAPKEGGATVMRIDADGDRMTVTVMRDDGRVLATRRIAAQAHADPAKRPSMSFIRVSEDGRRFARADSGAAFTPWGFNYDHDADGRLLEDYWEAEWATVEQDFAEMKALGATVVRVHLQTARFMEAPDRPNEAALNQFRRLLALAESTGLHLDVTGLGCYHKKDVPAWYDAMKEEDRWAVQARFWEAVARVGATSPAVFCYDLMNEPVVPGGKAETEWLAGELGGKHFVQRITLDPAGRDAKTIAKAWVDQLTTAIRKVDRRHLITVGVIPWVYSFPKAKPLFYSPEVAPHLDFVSVHFYPKKDDAAGALKALSAYAIGKPVVIEEMFPLACGIEELDRFIDGSREHAQGWIGFYWGRTIEEYSRPGATIGEAITKAWLEYFRDKTPSILPPRSSQGVDGFR